jgi:hypothetical protein
MSIEISQETEARLVAKASRHGISVNALLERLVNERAALVSSAKDQPELPVWSLGSLGALHRHDIYNDVR